MNYGPKVLQMWQPEPRVPMTEALVHPTVYIQMTLFWLRRQPRVTGTCVLTTRSGPSLDLNKGMYVGQMYTAVYPTLLCEEVQMSDHDDSRSER